MTWRFHFPLRNYDFNILAPWQMQAIKDKSNNIRNLKRFWHKVINILHENASPMNAVMFYWSIQYNTNAIKFISTFIHVCQ